MAVAEARVDGCSGQIDPAKDRFHLQKPSRTFSLAAVWTLGPFELEIIRGYRSYMCNRVNDVKFLISFARAQSVRGCHEAIPVYPVWRGQISSSSYNWLDFLSVCYLIQDDTVKSKYSSLACCLPDTEYNRIRAQGVVSAMLVSKVRRQSAAVSGIMI